MTDWMTIRWMIRRDMEDVLRIERESFKYPWTEEDFVCAFRNRNCIGMVYDATPYSSEHDIRGFMVYELHKNYLHVLNFAVAERFRRQGVATAMMARLKDKLSQQRRYRIGMEVADYNLPVQFFLKENGFRAVEVMRDHYVNYDCDGYRFVYDIRADDTVTRPA